MRDGSPELIERAGGADEPYRELLRGVRDRLAATLRAIEDRLDRHAVLEPFAVRHRGGAGRAARALPPLARADRQRPARARPPARSAAPRRGLRRHARASRSAAGRVATHGGALGDHARTWGWATTRPGTRTERQRFLLAGAGEPPAARAARSVGVAGSRRGPRRRSAWPRFCRPNRSARTSSR